VSSGTKGALLSRWRVGSPDATRPAALRPGQLPWSHASFDEYLVPAVGPREARTGTGCCSRGSTDSKCHDMAHRKTRGVAACLLALGIATATAAWAQSEESALQAARTLGNEGIELYEKGDYAGAEDRLERAFRVIQAPTLGLWLARSRAQNGKLVEASELYLQVSRMQVAADAPDVLREAVKDAAQERRSLDARIPTLTISLQEGESQQGIVILMDGNQLRAALLDVPIPVNPGKHEFEVRRADRIARGEVQLAEGEHKAVELVFKHRGEASSAPPPTPAPTESPTTSTPAAPPTNTAASLEPSPVPPQPDRTRPGKGQRIAGFVVLGVGGAGLATGGVLGVSAMRQRENLDNSGWCVQESCSVLLQRDVDDYNNTRIGSTIGFVAGGVGVAAGVTLLLTAPKQESARSRLEPWMGPTAAGIRGRF